MYDLGGKEVNEIYVIEMMKFKLHFCPLRGKYLSFRKIFISIIFLGKINVNSLSLER
jgi:hypothetical protein